MKSSSIWGIAVTVLVLIIILFGLSRLSSSGNTGGRIVSESGLHWHSTMSLSVKGVKQDLPANIGILPTVHLPMHTHDTDNVIHLEFGGLVRERDLALKVLFKNWGKDPSQLGTLTKTVVNGSDEPKGLEHIMSDGDKIELHFE